MVVGDSTSSADFERVVSAVRSSIHRPGFAADEGHIDVLADAPLPATTKLALLASLKDAGADRSDLVQLATSIVRDDLPTGVRPSVVAEQLVDRVVHAVGRDPLGRSGLDADPETVALMRNLIPEVATSALSVLPACRAERVDVAGQPVLFVRTELWSSSTLAAFEPVIDPERWPDCPVQSYFFKSMVPVTPHQPLPKPDIGWSSTLTETVDFGFGTGLMKTNLDFVYHASSNSIGCTYKMPPNGSLDGKIVHDEGFLLAQDLGASRNARRITTLKAVWFSDKNTPVDEVCPVWSFAAGLVAHSCLQER
jgi:hypothetical protein